MDRLSESGAIAWSKEPRTCRADVASPPDGRAFLSPDLASPAARDPRGSSLPFARRSSLRRRLRGRAAAGALVALALGFASLLHAAETTVSQFAAGATWSLHGETSPVPGGTYTYTITRTAGTEPDNEYAGFHVPSTSRSVAHSNLGSNPMSCGTGKYFCASFSPSRIPGIWNNLQGHHTIYTLINNNRTITATLTVTADTPIGTTISFGAIESNGRPRSGGLLLTVSTKPPDPTPPTLVSATTKTLTIKWTHPGDGGSPLVRNYLHYRVQGTTEWSNWYAGETPVTRAAIGGLQANTAYDVRVSVTNASGSSEWVMGATAFSTRANAPATGAPTITGTAGVGQVLTASTTSIADADGLPATFSYQWVRVDADGTSNPVDIPGATDASYTLTAADVGKKVKVKVNFTDDLETTETLTSAAFPSGCTVVAAVAACPVPDFAGRRKIWTAVLTMGDFTTQGLPLRGYGRFPDAGGDGGGLDPATFTIGLNEYAVDILAVDAIRLYFSLPLRAIWRTPATAALRLHVCNAPYDFSDSHYAWDGRSNVIPEHAWDTALDWSSVSTRTVHLSLPDNRSATGAPGITGTVEVGQVLGGDVTGIEDEDGLYDVEYAYQWVRVDADGTSNEEDISGATAATYTLTADDVGKKVKVEVSFTDDFGSDEQRPSAPTATVTAAATAACAVPSLSGRNVIWTGAMTVAVDPDNAGVFGFESGSFGTLDDQTFTVGTNDYRTRLVSLLGNVLTFATTNDDLTAGEKDVLRLHVCAADLDFSAAGGPTGDHGYVFSTTGLSWSSGDTVTLRLSLPATATAQVMGVGVAPGNAQLVVTWTAVDTATGYTVQWTSGGEDYNTTRQATVTPGSTTRHTIEGLANGTAYTVRVIATRTGATDGPPSAEMTGTPAAPGVTVSTTALTVPEEDTTGDSYTVVLATQPTANVRVTVAGHAGTTVTPTPGTLTFTTMNWDTAQTVTVTAGHDADTADESVSLTHSATSPDSDYEGIPITSVAVAVTDNDTAQVMGVGVAPGDAHLVVTWTAVDTATGYTVQWRSGGEDYNTGDRQATVTPGATTRHTIDSLTNGTAYTVRVIATRTGATDGPPSAEVTGTPTGEPEPVPALPLAGAIGLGLLLLGTGGRALRGRASG